MTRYAEGTSVASDRSRAEIERILERYGATSFMYGWQQGSAVVAFEANGRRIRFILPLPARDDDAFMYTAAGRVRAETSRREAYEQAVRQRWRALALVIKAKLEAVESGISEFDSEFLANIVLPDNSTAGEFMLPQIDEVYRTGRMPALLPGVEERALLLGPTTGH